MSDEKDEQGTADDPITGPALSFSPGGVTSHFYINSGGSVQAPQTGKIGASVGFFTSSPGGSISGPVTLGPGAAVKNVTFTGTQSMGSVQGVASSGSWTTIFDYYPPHECMQPEIKIKKPDITLDDAMRFDTGWTVADPAAGKKWKCEECGVRWKKSALYAGDVCELVGHSTWVKIGPSRMKRMRTWTELNVVEPVRGWAYEHDARVWALGLTGVWVGTGAVVLVSGL